MANVQPVPSVAARDVRVETPAVSKVLVDSRCVGPEILGAGTPSALPPLRDDPEFPLETQNCPILGPIPVLRPFVAGPI